MTPRRSATFRIDDEILDALQRVKDVHGISVSDQVDRALLMWLEAMGRPVLKREETMRLLERLEGVGEVSREADGKVIGQRQYDLSVWQRVHRVTNMESTTTIDGLKSVQGSLVMHGSAAELALVGDSLVLVLEDGRRLPFFLQDSDGVIAARGPLA